MELGSYWDLSFFMDLGHHWALSTIEFGPHIIGPIEWKGKIVFYPRSQD